FRDHCTQAAVEEAKRTGWSAALWEIVERAQLPLVSVPESHGGAGGTLSDLAAVLRVAGRYSVPLPLAETGMLAGWMLAASGWTVPQGPLAAVIPGPDDDLRLEAGVDAWFLHGHVQRVPWASVASRLVVLAPDHDGSCRVACVNCAQCSITRGHNLAWEPRDDVRFHGIALREGELRPAGPGVAAGAAYRRGALARALLMAGALDRALELS